ncbi:glycerate kinase [Undibacterium cyanobacteriorum]|uniref:Glycerate kinase n=1 Tax=Undibacterium cyanobacteriorum TaxID=3073561 RepID=A0ABY9RHN1_9BURK|nr:glycerate kinase [Undibacterium sp. 20NA77.5]WMW80733.1 glycerate kinase [Undibacterium sp. 20NA77.5]
MFQPDHDHAESFLRRLFAEAIAAVVPATCIPPALQNFRRTLSSQPERVIVIGAGKAAAAMAYWVEQAWSDLALEGLVITRYGHLDPKTMPRRIQVIEAAHPVPDHAGTQAAQALLQRSQGLHEGDLVLALWSGGGSALMSLPSNGLSLAEKQEINRALLRCGASIHEINCVRKHLSAIKGGRLALACAPARIHSLVISDVAGDDASVIASGPTLPDASTSAQALDILRRYRVPISTALEGYLQLPESETPKHFPTSLNLSFELVAQAQTALNAAAQWARAQGIEVTILSDRLDGDARTLGREHAALAIQLADQAQPKAGERQLPQLLLSGGETTVTLTGLGRGGRNTEYLLSCCLHLQGHPRIYALAADTDGIDGSEDNAGAWIGPHSLARAAQQGLSAQEFLHNNDAYSFFERLGGLLVTGPTLTNVNDFRAILILPE